jgi:hypothetical protein
LACTKKQCNEGLQYEEAAILAARYESKNFPMLGELKTTAELTFKMQWLLWALDLDRTRLVCREEKA